MPKFERAEIEAAKGTPKAYPMVLRVIREDWIAEIKARPYDKDQYRRWSMFADSDLKFAIQEMLPPGPVRTVAEKHRKELVDTLKLSAQIAKPKEKALEQLAMIELAIEEAIPKKSYGKIALGVGAALAALGVGLAILGR
jgi:hypothetical protein